MEAIVVALAIVLVGTLGWFADASGTVEARALPPTWRFWFGLITKMGESGYMFALSGFVLVAAILARSRWQGRQVDAALAYLAGRAAFFVTVLATSGLVAQALKHTFGRARPKLFDSVGPYHFDVGALDSTYASFPSGHTVSAFAAATTLLFFLPRLGPALMGLACLVGVSRVIVGAHYPSDVAAGALIGTATAVLMRRAFAARRIAFRMSGRTSLVRGAGSLRALAGILRDRSKRV